MNKYEDYNRVMHLGLELVQQQRKMIQAGVMNARQVAEQKIIGEVVSEQ